MRFFLGKGLSFLFASTQHQQQCSQHGHFLSVPLRSTASPEADVAAVTVSSTISPPRKVVQDVQQIYRELENVEVEESSTTSKIIKTYSPTISFTYMPSGDTIKTDEDDEMKRKPILLYLPGLDGLGISCTTQFDDLSKNFEFWRLMIDKTSDRSSFSELTSAVASFILNDLDDKEHRDIILVGESFGGLLASSVALRVQSLIKRRNQIENEEKRNPIKGLCMVNPATSFDRTQWSTYAPILSSLRHLETSSDNKEKDLASSGTSLFSSLPTPYSVVGGIALALTIPDRDQYQSIFDIFKETKVNNLDDLQDVFGSMRDGFGILEENLPAEVVEHRVGRWLPVGVEIMNEKKLGEIEVDTLVIAGEDDNMLPSKEEAERLVDIMENATSMSVKGSGHFILDDRFNLTKAILDHKPFDLNKDEQKKEDFSTRKKYDVITDWKLPEERELKEYIENRVKPLRLATSPKFFSTGQDGIRRQGLGKVPSMDKSNSKNRPILFVANHQLLGLDLGLIIAELIEERGIAARGLAHPFVFQTQQGGGGGPFGGSSQNKERITKKDKNGIVVDEQDPSKPPPSSVGDFQTFGAVMVTPKNYYRLMQTGQAGLLFPGGVREVFHGKDEAYELFWPEKVDFVRIASKFNATIIPISAVGAADSASILLDNTEILDLPFGLGERALNNTQNTIAARFDAESNSDELFQPPLVIPKLTPSRHYFVFGKPFDTSIINQNDKEQCEKLYIDVKTELRRGLDDILSAREKDPYKDFEKRFVTEQITGKQTPTFPIEELNKH